MGGGPATRSRNASAEATIAPMSKAAGASARSATGEPLPANHSSIPAGAKVAAIRDFSERTR